ncbi:uncharacterized protein LOC121779027 [Salvia splendens]|uniref:uncharacterized protein LOC121779027 n=1 Tax=Salvia splendens TaxID=180675 RepID=UPI001C26A433|nr:uncharacterized protein LOC121779027 [Salvia splendens]
MSVSFMIWNARGLGNFSTLSTLKHLIKTYKLDFVAISEPLVSPQPDLLKKRLGMEFRGVNTNGQIWLLSQSDVGIDILDSSDQLLHCRVTAQRWATAMYISTVYGKCTRPGRYSLWNKMREIAGEMDGSPWLIGGDFNTLISEIERQGGSHNRYREMLDFAEAIEDCQLLDPGFDSLKYTWARGTLRERLDRVLIGEGWTSAYSSTRITHLPWVANVWSADTGYHGMRNLQLKLTRTKGALRRWNKEVFGNLFANLRKAKEDAVKAQELFDTTPSPANRMNMNRATAEYILQVRMDEDFWKQKSAIKWITEGERNTKFFHG